jgi:streptothricin acetyltransferase
MDIVRLDDGNGHLYNSVPSRFALCGMLHVSMRDGSLLYEFVEFPPPHPVKTYPDDAYHPRGRHAVFFALAGGQCAGQVHIEEHWNGMARVEDIRVTESCRGRGIGRLLLDAAIAWAREQGFPAVCLETQSNNIAACRFYAAYGFALKGVDVAVYDATASRGEIALYWYLPLAG